VDAARAKAVALVAGTFDTKGPELRFIAERLAALGRTVRTVDLSTSGAPSPADVAALEVAAHHPKGRDAVFTGDRGKSITAMAEAFANWIEIQRDVGGVIGAGGSGGTALATAAMRRLPIGVPKIMVSTMASGDVSAYVGSTDIMMMYSVVDVQGLNAISEQVLGNAASALAGMISARANAAPEGPMAKPAIGMTMFGVTTPCVQALQTRLGGRFDCLVFHATGIGGRTMEKLADSGLVEALIDITTTEVADMIVGGVLACDADRFGAPIRTGLPYVGSLGALDMVNFGPRDKVPARFEGRNFVVHNAQVTLMRTTPEENKAFGEWIGGRLNEMAGPVRFLLPLGGVSMLDAPGKPFHDPVADKALFDAIERTVRQTASRRLISVNANINDPIFAEAALEAFESIYPKG
jgi:uncharacterized protein (UPF0261 family)